MPKESDTTHIASDGNGLVNSLPERGPLPPKKTKNKNKNKNKTKQNLGYWNPLYIQEDKMAIAIPFYIITLTFNAQNCVIYPSLMKASQLNWQVSVYAMQSWVGVLF